jgi:uncharacterized protein (DUF362 family)
MTKNRFRIGIRHGDNPAVMTIEVLREIVTRDFHNKSVLIKPNLGFLSSSGTGVVTHCEVVRGVIRFMKEAGALPFVGDSCIFGVNQQEAFEKSGALAVTKEEGVELINLDEGEPVVIEIPAPLAVDQVKISSHVAHADCIVSVPVMKTHMYTIASLSLKNMKGCLYQREKMRFHHLREEERFAPWHAFKNLDRAVADLSSGLYADLVVIDGIVAMEGLGPMIGEPKPLDLVLAAEDPIAADTAAAFLMGFKGEEIPHLHLAAWKMGGRTDFDDLDLDRDRFVVHRSPFKHAVAEDISAQHPEFAFSTGETCSACEATAMAFLKYHGEKYKGIETVHIVMGRRVDPKKVARERCIVLGNCAAKLRDMGIFLEGCPPIPSDLLKALDCLENKKHA